jgi:hypothetical protein
MKKLLFKILGKFVNHNHKHKIIRIRQSFTEGVMTLYHLQMDCHDQPEKMVLVKTILLEGHSFDPHFSNEYVIASFQPTAKGWDNGLKLISANNI